MQNSQPYLKQRGGVPRQAYTPSQFPKSTLNISGMPNTQTATSFNRMMGGGTPSFGDLEAASMRLADAASARSMEEERLKSGLRMGETAQEYGLRGDLTAKEYGLRGDLERGNMSFRDYLDQSREFRNRLDTRRLNSQQQLRDSVNSSIARSRAYSASRNRPRSIRRF